MPSLASLKVLINKLRWFAYDKFTSVWDWVVFVLQPPTSRNKFGTGSKGGLKGGRVVVYVGEFLPPRIARVAKWSKRLTPYSLPLTTILLCHKRGFVEKFSNPDIDHIILFRNKWHLKRIIRSFKDIYVMHGFAPKSKYPAIAMKMLRKRFPGKKFIADYQDTFAVYYGLEPKFGWLKEELPYEKDCLAHADGIIANSLEPREGMKIWGIKDHCPRLFFPLYADNDYFKSRLTPYSLPLTTNDIHLVYAGGVNGSHRDKVHYGVTQFHWLITYLDEQKIHFHIYPSPSVIKADYEEYEQIAKNSTYFHYHEPVSQSKLPEELAKYHYGLMPFFHGDGGQSALKYKYATTLKLFNYVEAGIPILVAKDVQYQSWLVSRYSLGITVNKKDDFKDVRKLIGGAPYSEQVEKLLKNREHLSLKTHIPRLLEFYEKIRNY